MFRSVFQVAAPGLESNIREKRVFDFLEEFETGSGQTSVTLTRVPSASKAQHRVYVNGMLMRKDVDYEISESTITFLRPVEEETSVVIYFNS